jgi:hypothetical protein
MKVVGIHGIGQTYVGGPQIERSWFPALLSGLESAGEPVLEPEDFGAVGYGSLFRPSGQRGDDEPSVGNLDEWEQTMLVAWWREAARLSAESREREDPLAEEPTLQGPDFDGRGRTPTFVQHALAQVARSRFFHKIGSQRVLLLGLRQVRRFLHEEAIKQAVLERVRAVVTSETRVLVGHSLGSIVAYEALCAHDEWNVDVLVTLGAPLGIPELVFDQLTPRPIDGMGAWPRVRRWVNVADRGDIVALAKKLSPLFRAPDGRSVFDILVYNGWQSHSAERYLSARETGAAIAEGLTR